MYGNKKNNHDLRMCIIRNHSSALPGAWRTFEPMGRGLVVKIAATWRNVGEWWEYVCG